MYYQFGYKRMMEVVTGLLLLTFLVNGWTITQGIECPVGWRGHKSSCYYFSNSELDWYQALDQCIILQGYLVEIDDSDENTFITSVIHENSYSDYYIGLSDINQEGTWKWMTSGNSLGFTYWGPGEPNSHSGEGEDCVQFQLDPPMWNDELCSASFRYICEKATCGNPASIANGNIFLNCGTMHQDTASVTCDAGFERSVNTISCTASGSWEAVTCDPISCGNPSTIANGNTVLNSGTTYQDTASVTCHVGFERSASTIKCTVSGSWEVATCDPISCGNPVSVTNGTIVLNSGTVYQDSASVTCDAGYEGSVNTISCTASGSWEAVTCDPISCGNLSTIANGTIVLNNGTTFQETASVTCDVGFEQSSNTTRCTESGSWEAVACDLISCGNLSTIANGTIVLNNGTTYQETASVTCDVGFEQSSNTTRCTESGSWEAVACYPISCGNPPSIDNGNITLNSGTTYLDTASITCNMNFQANSSTISCAASGNWETATCNAVGTLVPNLICILIMWATSKIIDTA